MSLAEIRVVAHHHVDFPSTFAVRLESDGRLLAIGMDPLKAAAHAAKELGMAVDSTVIVARYASGKPYSDTATVAEAMLEDPPPPMAA